jgi:hypothetical protein
MHPLRKALRMPSVTCAQHGKKKARFFLSSNFNGLRLLIAGTSMCRGTSAQLHRGSLALVELRYALLQAQHPHGFFARRPKRN